MSAEQFITEHLDLWTEAVTAKPASGRGSNGKIELTGIRKLRELILELAIRGNLVPQDSMEGTSSQLLAQIANEKERLIQEGQAKRAKKLREISDAEKPYSLPESWRFARLGDVVEIVRGITFPASEKSSVPENGRVACLRTSNIQEAVEWDDLLYIRQQFISKSTQFIQKHDIIMSMANSRSLVGKVAIINEAPEDPITFGGFLGVIRPVFLSSRFLTLILKAPNTRQILIGSASQTTNIANISVGKLKPLVIGVPPITEQHRIVQKVDELMVLCDRLEQQTRDQHAAHETLVDALLDTLTQSKDADELADNWTRLAAHFDTLFTTEHSIERLKQSILQLAILGRLVPQNPNDEPASILLENTSAQKARLAKEGHIKKNSNLPPIPEEDRPFEAPAGWKWTRLGEITQKIGSGATPRGGKASYKSKGVPFLRSQNIWNDGLKLNEVAYISPDMHNNMSSTHVCPYDILLNITGASLGRCTIVPIDLKQANVSQHVTIIRSIGEVSRDYLHLAILSPYIQKLVWGRQVGMAREGLSKKVLEMFEFPIPPMDEQLRIVKKTNELLAVCDQLKARLIQAGDTRRQMADAVVEQTVH